LGRKLLQSLRAEAGRRANQKLSSKVFLKKSSSLSVKAAQLKVASIQGVIFSTKGG
jgi:hypothetical protein